METAFNGNWILGISDQEKEEDRGGGNFSGKTAMVHLLLGTVDYYTVLCGQMLI